MDENLKLDKCDGCIYWGVPSLIPSNLVNEYPKDCTFFSSEADGTLFPPCWEIEETEE